MPTAPWLLLTVVGLALTAGCVQQPSGSTAQRQEAVHAPVAPAKDGTEGLLGPAPPAGEPEIDLGHRRARPRPPGLEAGIHKRAQRAFAEQAVVADALRLPGVEPLDHETYARLDEHGVRRVAEHPVSTFSIDVDTGAYSNLRRILNEGRLPPRDAVRIEELINYFAYGDAPPASEDRPFAVHTEIGPAPWNAKTRLLRVAVRAWQAQADQLPPANLVFLIDVSGSMRAPDKLELLKRSLRLLVGRLDGEDRVSLVVYAGASGVVLEPTPGDRRAKIEQALARLRAGGSTNGAAGIRLAYAKAREAFIAGGVNRVILATDGDFNVGTVDHRALVDLIERQRAAGIALTTLGFGRGNYNDRLMEQLADHGNGNHAYIDRLMEAQKVLVDELGASLHTVAEDVKIQIEFNPARVAEYRLIGYENRALRREDFANDRVDAGEIGAGHSVVALYEIALVDGAGQRIPPLRYGRRPGSPSQSDELAHLRLRFKRPGSARSELIERPVFTSELQTESTAMSDDYRFAAAVAAFGQRLRGGRYLEAFEYRDILELARGARGEDPDGLRSDFLRLVRLAESLSPDAIDAQVAGR